MHCAEIEPLVLFLESSNFSVVTEPGCSNKVCFYRDNCIRHDNNQIMSTLELQNQYSLVS